MHIVYIVKLIFSEWLLLIIEVIDDDIIYLGVVFIKFILNKLLVLIKFKSYFKIYY